MQYLHFLSSSGLLIGSFLDLLLALAAFFGLQWGPGRMDLYRRFRGLNLLDLLLTLLLLASALLLFHARRKMKQRKKAAALFLSWGILLPALSLFLYGAGLCLLLHTNVFMLPALVLLLLGLVLFFIHRSVFRRFGSCFS